MSNLFQKTSSNWARYDKYEWKEDKEGTLYITPSPDAKVSLYNPLKDSEQMVLKAVNLGLMCMDKNNTQERLQNAIMDFVTGFDFVKKGMESSWSTDDVQMMALIMTMKNKPQAVMMSFQKEYAERYDWLVTLFKDWAFTFMSSFLYYQDFDMLDDMQKQLYRQGMAAFGGIAPTYHIELLERPTIVWDFHSLLLGVQMMFSFMLTDEKSSLKVCKHCGNAFVACRPNSVFCSGKCKNRYNVYKSRAKDKDNNN